MSDRLTKPRSKKIAGGFATHHGTGFTYGKMFGRGVVNYFVHGPLKNAVEAGFNPSRLIEVLEAGLPVKELTDLQASLAVSAERLAPMLGISKATFHRRKSAGDKLKTTVSDRVV